MGDEIQSLSSWLPLEKDLWCGVNNEGESRSQMEGRDVAGMVRKHRGVGSGKMQTGNDDLSHIGSEHSAIGRAMDDSSSAPQTDNVSGKGKGKGAESGWGERRKEVEFVTDQSTMEDDETGSSSGSGRLGDFLSFLTGKSYPQEDSLESFAEGTAVAPATSSTPRVTLASTSTSTAAASTSASTKSMSSSTLWARRVEYVHNDKGGLFSAQSSSNHSLVQLMRVTVKPSEKDRGNVDGSENDGDIDIDRGSEKDRQRREAEITEEVFGDDTDNDHDSEKEEENENSDDYQNDIRNAENWSPIFTESVTIVGFMNLSNMPFCQNCTYKTRWEFRNTEIENGSKKSNKNMDVRKNGKMGTEISVFLTIDCPSSIYHSFIVSGIKKELKAVVDQFQLSATKLLEEIFFCEKTVRGEGEKRLIEIIGKDFESYEVIREEVKLPIIGIQSRERMSRNRDSDSDDVLGERRFGRRDVSNTDEDPDSRSSDASSRYDTRSNRREGTGWVDVDHSDINSNSNGNGNGDNSGNGKGEGTGKGEGDGVSSAVSVYAPDMELSNKFVRLRNHWRLSAIVMTSLKRAPTAFSDHLAFIGLRRKRRTGILSILRLRVFFRILFWGGLSAGAIEISKRSGDIAGATVAAKRNVRDFVQRRITTPTMSIMNDVVLNRRVTILDKEALIDARRSLSVMLYDFLSQHKPKLTEQERRRLVNGLDMRPISEEYERELRYVSAVRAGCTYFEYHHESYYRCRHCRPNLSLIFLV